ncbi:alpha/beta hydrolase [Verrucomicrobia bacterium S94]|nr:alpha/beta hydrolase [Verrucomicrobia bacterium S94]
MKKREWKLSGVLAAFCFLSMPESMFAQEFRISEYDGDSITVEYPPCFDGAYLFVEQGTNLVDQNWETVDYTQVSLAEEDAVSFAVSSTGRTAAATGAISAAELPETGGEHESGFVRISAVSFVDSDGDGLDNVTEYALNLNPYEKDAPQVSLPEDDGDPRPVPGSVDSAPGDWNTPPSAVYRNAGSAYELINHLILALEGTNGTFTAQTSAAALGGWIEQQCGSWYPPLENDRFPIVYGGRFFRMETNGFEWVGKEHIYPLAFYDYAASGYADAVPQFINHLVRSSETDRPGLALLPDGSSVLVNAENPWTPEKVNACLQQFRTVVCRLQSVDENGGFAASDSNAMARATWNYWGTYNAATEYYHQPQQLIRSEWKYNAEQGEWEQVPNEDGAIVTIFAQNQQFEFTGNLRRYGFGRTVHRGYMKLMDEVEWQIGYPDETSAYKRRYDHLPEGFRTNGIFRTFTASDHETAWLAAAATNYSAEAFWDWTAPDLTGGTAWTDRTLVYDRGGYIADGYVYSGYYPSYVSPDDYTVLSTLSPPVFTEQSLIMDMDRNGAIDADDFYRVDASHPYRFWMNEDGNDAAYPEADMEDFFPAMFKGTGSAQTFKLSANIDMDYIQTTMLTNNTQAYLHDIDLAQSLAGQIRSLDAGDQSPAVFSENEIVLLAASEVNTNAQIYVHTLENGVEISISTNYFSFSSVTNMYRIKNLRAGGVSFLDPPSNWPDELTNDRDFVFVHGYNVTESAGHEWNKTIFKRLWHSGSNARYHALLWDGSPPASGDKKHYHNAVVNAFATAPDFADYLNSLNDPVVAAHSLGNMVTSSAICDHGANVYQYYMLNAAVAKEAYGDSAPNENMIPDGSLIYNQNEGIFSVLGYSWHKYPFETYASEWYRLFDTSDARSELTWRHRFADIQTKTDAFNFYSSTEDILRVDTGYTTIVSGLLHGDLGLYAFQLQELFKGKDDPIANAGGGSDPYTGWGFTTNSDTHIFSMGIPRTDIGLNLWPRWPHYHHEQLETNAANTAVRNAFRETLKTDPLFRPNPPVLFEPGAEAFAGSTIGLCGYTFNYDLPSATIDIADVPVRDYLLAKSFPARTGALGSRAISEQVSTEWQKATFDMFNLYRTDEDAWPSREGINNIRVWKHSDFRNVPYVHVYQLYEKITGKEN